MQVELFVILLLSSSKTVPFSISSLSRASCPETLKYGLFLGFKDKKPLEGTIYIFFDLYRLKRINDVYSHQKGDEYISKTTEILKRQFPEYIYTVDPTGKKTKVATGNKLYRVGGDEFILISDTESYQNALYKVMIIQDEVSHIDLNLGTHEILGINYGLLQSKKDDTYRDLYINSNALLEDNKTANYQKLGIERRK